MLSLATVICNAETCYVCASFVSSNWQNCFMQWENLFHPMDKTVLLNGESLLSFYLALPK